MANPVERGIHCQKEGKKCWNRPTFPSCKMAQLRRSAFGPSARHPHCWACESIHWHVHEVSRKRESCSHGLDGDIDGRTGSQNCNECGFTTPKMTQTLLVLFGSPHGYPLFESYQSIQQHVMEVSTRHECYSHPAGGDVDCQR